MFTVKFYRNSHRCRFIEQLLTHALCTSTLHTLLHAHVHANTHKSLVVIYFSRTLYGADREILFFYQNYKDSWFNITFRKSKCRMQQPRFWTTFPTKTGECNWWKFWTFIICESETLCVVPYVFIKKTKQQINRLNDWKKIYYSNSITVCHKCCISSNDYEIKSLGLSTTVIMKTTILVFDKNFDFRRFCVCTKSFIFFVSLDTVHVLIMHWNDTEKVKVCSHSRQDFFFNIHT